MSSKKSLGSSPIGFSGRSQNSYRFIRDLGVSRKSNTDSVSDRRDGTSKLKTIRPHQARSVKSMAIFVDREKRIERKQPEKKIVSYYLEVGLVDRLKKVADQRGEYYSTVVSKALTYWIDQHDS